MPDACANPADWDNRIVQTTFIKYPDCYAGTPAGIAMSGIAGPDSCSIKCASSLNMVFWMNAAVSLPDRVRKSFSEHIAEPYHLVSGR
jgi:hypothetical protein